MSYHNPPEVSEDAEAFVDAVKARASLTWERRQKKLSFALAELPAEIEHLKRCYARERAVREFLEALVMDWMETYERCAREFGGAAAFRGTALQLQRAAIASEVERHYGDLREAITWDAISADVFPVWLLNETQNDEQALMRRVDSRLNAIALEGRVRFRPAPEVSAGSPQDPLALDERPGAREARLKRFIEAHPDVRIKDIQKAAAVDPKDFSLWRNDALAFSSVMAQRIEDVLAGRRGLPGARRR